MLIVPVENKLDWKKPPVITLLLIIINCVVFFSYQISDNKRIAEIIQLYDETNLWEQERALYLNHLKQNKPMQWRLTAINSEQDDVAMRVSMLHDLDFETQIHLLENYQTTPWQEQRKPIEQLRNKVSYVEYGFNPAFPTWTDAFVSMFLHGSFSHLLGNMIFLIIFGCALESLLGGSRYLLIYLATGFCSTALYLVAEYGNSNFGIGASGAISGLMGAYLATYRFRKISFFYWIGFYFNYIKAPALLIFPFWLGKEVIGQLYSSDNVNYWAHIGGLLGGLLLTLVMQKLSPPPKPDEQVQENPLLPQLKRLDLLIEQLKTKQAAQLCQQLLEEQPKSPELLLRYFQLSRHQRNKNYHLLILRIIQLPDGEPETDLIQQVTRDYCHKGKKQNLLQHEKIANHWLKRLIKDKAFDDGGMLADAILTEANLTTTAPSKIITQLIADIVIANQHLNPKQSSALQQRLEQKSA